MNWWALAVIVAGGLGAVVRALLSMAIATVGRDRFPVSTVVINVSGALLLGLATGLAAAELLPAEWRLVVSTGFLGGYTTFSTASNDAARLARGSHVIAAAVNAFGMLVLAIAAAGLGLWIGALM